MMISRPEIIILIIGVLGVVVQSTSQMVQFNSQANLVLLNGRDGISMEFVMIHVS